MNYPLHQSQMREHYTWLIVQPGWRQYTQERVMQMARECPDLYADLPGLVKAALTEAAANARGRTELPKQ